MKCYWKILLPVVMGVYAAGCVSMAYAGQAAGLFSSVKGKQFVIAGISTGDMPVFNDVLIFNEDGSFVMKKMESYGEGEYFEFINGSFYFIFNNRGGIDIQFAEATGFSMPGSFGQPILGFGSFMIDYQIAPMVFTGVEVFQEQEKIGER